MAENQLLAPNEPTAAIAAVTGALNPQELYSRYNAKAYGLLRLFMPEDDAREEMQRFAVSLLNLDPNQDFNRYSELLVFRCLIENLQKRQELCLYLRDRFLFSCEEVAAILGISVGSVRTRLQLLREKSLNEPTPQTVDTQHAPQSTHYCIFAREQIEDWPLEIHPRSGRAEIPSELNALAETCAECTHSIRLRARSIENLHAKPLHTLPQDLQAFAASPLFIRKGNRTFLNWSGAPWYLRVLVEGLFATTIVMGIVLSLPRLKSVYELWLEKRMDLGSLAELAATINQRNTATSEPAPAPQPGDTGTSSIDAQSDVGPLPPPNFAATAGKPRTTVMSEFSERDTAAAASHKIYRILIKTDSPDGIRDGIRKLLVQLSFYSEQQGAEHGVELPGGIMFDVYVPVKSYKALLNELGKLGDTKVIITQSHSHVIPGKARVKIWLQRI